MARLFANNAVSVLSSPISSFDTTITVSDASLFPTPSASDWYTITLTQANAETSWEEVKVTAKAGNVLTVVRAQEGTTSAAWSANDKAEIRWTAAAASASLDYAISGMVVLDFGSGSTIASTEIFGQTDIGANSQIDAWIMGVDSADHNAYEHMIVPITIRAGYIVPGVGFTVFGSSSQQLTGQYVAQWVRTH